jgi:hypothetical protein
VLRTGGELFIGHYAVAMAAKRFVPRASLGALIAAASFLDLIWPIFLLFGLEEVEIEPGATRLTPLNFVSYPISHSLVSAVAWATLFAVFYQIVAHYKAGTIAVWIAVLSHWFLDAIVHRPDLPLYAGGPKYGFGLWNHPRATIAVEVAMYALGVWLYWRATKARDGIGRWASWAFVLTLLVFYFVNIFGPPPPSVKVLAIAALGFGWLLVVWAWWFDAHRESTST